MGNAFDSLITRSPAMEAVIRSAQIVAATDATALVQGETGTGKELMARALHAASPRADRPFVAVNCASLPEALVESMLFGHRRGAFTGADADHGGFIREAAGGTLFLDEVSELPLTVQAKLLRFLEAGECQPVGEARPVKVDVRVVAASNEDLQARVTAGDFREDLYYRLQVVPLELPSLRSRKGDVPLLLRHFLREFARRHRTEAPSFDAHAMDLLRNHDWPGNIRELRNLCERVVVLFGGRTLGPGNLPAEIRQGRARHAGRGLVELPDEGIRLDELERDLLEKALVKAEGNKSRAARLLGLTRDTFLYRLKKYAL